MRGVFLLLMTVPHTAFALFQDNEKHLCTVLSNNTAVDDNNNRNISSSPKLQVSQPPAKCFPLLHFSSDTTGVTSGLRIFPVVEKEFTCGCSGSVLTALRGTQKRAGSSSLLSQNLRRKRERRVVQLKPSCMVQLQCGWKNWSEHLFSLLRHFSFKELRHLWPPEIPITCMDPVTSTGQKNHPGIHLVCLVKAEFGSHLMFDRFKMFSPKK